MRGIRQHVNPLGGHFLAARAEPISLPGGRVVEVELGCADARFSFDLAARHPERFVVGLEIRENLVEMLKARARRDQVPNLAFGYVNLNVDLDRVFRSASVHRFHLLFPDPWFKQRHRKRRVVEAGLLEVMLDQLVPGGELHFASDVFELALDAMAEFEGPDALALGLSNVAGPWRFTRTNPCEAVSRRELTTLERGQRVWRMRYRKHQSSTGERA